MQEAHNMRLLQLLFCILVPSVNAEARHCLPVLQITPDHVHIESGFGLTRCASSILQCMQEVIMRLPVSHIRSVMQQLNHKVVGQSGVHAPDDAESGIPAVCVRPRPACWRLLIAPLHTRQQSIKVSEVGALGVERSLLKKIKGGLRLCRRSRSF